MVKKGNRVIENVALLSKRGEKGMGVKIIYFNNPLKGHVYNRKLTIYWANQKVRGEKAFLLKSKFCTGLIENVNSLKINLFKNQKFFWIKINFLSK